MMGVHRPSAGPRYACLIHIGAVSTIKCNDIVVFFRTEKEFEKDFPQGMCELGTYSAQMIGSL